MSEVRKLWGELFGSGKKGEAVMDGRGQVWKLGADGLWECKETRTKVLPITLACALCPDLADEFREITGDAA